MVLKTQLVCSGRPFKFAARCQFGPDISFVTFDIANTRKAQTSALLILLAGENFCRQLAALFTTFGTATISCDRRCFTTFATSSISCIDHPTQSGSSPKSTAATTRILATFDALPPPANLAASLRSCGCQRLSPRSQRRRYSATRSGLPTCVSVGCGNGGGASQSGTSAIAGLLF